MKDVATMAGVSQSTVSRILSGVESRVPIAEETRSRVLRISHEVGYRPNLFARGLRGSGTNLLGVIVREVVDPFFGLMVDAIMTEARQYGYNVVLGDAHNSADEAGELEEILTDIRHCDAIIVIGDVKGDFRSDAPAGRVPLVALCQGARRTGVPTIGSDQRRGVRLALEYLYGLGHRRIAFIDAGWIGDVQERRAAFFEFLHERGMSLVDGYHQFSTNDPRGGQRAFEALAKIEPRPTAVFASTDVIAFGVLNAAWQAGIRVPEEVSVIGFDDIPFAAFTIPTLTTIRQSIQELARLSVQQARQMLVDPAPDPAQRLVVQPELVIRGSCDVASE
jgi:DNA-binding LacI/PurR family transcriptional regulator